MTIPAVERSAIERALEVFDEQLRHSEEWVNWESNRAQTWVLNCNGKRYPPKKIVSLATDAPVNSFSGGDETNEFLSARGFQVDRLRTPMLAETFRLILERYGHARASEKFAGNHEIKELFTQSRKILERSPPVATRDHLSVVASYGKGNWATIPWISLLDDRETRTTQDGVYAVYLFREDGAGFYLKLAQGVTTVEKEHGGKASEFLSRRAAEIRQQCEGLRGHGFDMAGESDLASDQRLAKLYEASTIAAKFYPKGDAFDDASLFKDLDAVLEAYEQYVASKRSDGRLAEDSRRVSLIGTWRGARHQATEIHDAVRRNGAWASPWSFPVRPEAISRLAPPFFLYAYEGDGKLSARLEVGDFQTSKGQGGIVSPWPEVTNEEWRGTTRSGDRQSDVFKTWFKVVGIEVLNPPKRVDDFELAMGLSSPENVLNQNTFGYVIEEQTTHPQQPLAPMQGPALVAPLDLEWLVARTRLKRRLLQDLVDALLGDSPQLLLAGPPGTSKTFLAQQLALYAARNQADRVQLVQFHPSYSYEAFIEGIRPVSKGGAISFELQPGVVRAVVAGMLRSGTFDVPGHEHVIIIDEANRANLPRVLGELMYLFEYRGQSVRLQYSGDFALPANLRFIATMNTADRSIRAIDVALRRRFDVFEFGPDPELLAEYYGSSATSSIPSLVDGFVALNLALEQGLDRHHTIGHAFFMRPHMDAVTLGQIWRRRIYPLIEEFFFDQPEQAAAYSLDRFWPDVSDAPQSH